MNQVLQPTSPTDIRSAYVHVPFCRHRCGYCNFTVVAKRDDLIETYLTAIEKEISGLKIPQPVDTLFLGGGTPTHLSPSQLERFLALLLQWLPLRDGAEFSVEANPEDIDPDRIRVLADAGVNRISLGVQSFRDPKLSVLERSHRSEDVERVVELIRNNIHSLSLDLIFGTPGETLDDWQYDLQRTFALCPDHLSTYGLTYEQGTRFHVRRDRNEIHQLPEELERQMYELAIDQAERHGFEHYEVSNFAQSGHRCRHNQNYWRCGQFYGFGPGASAFMNGVRQSNHRSTTTWLKRVLSDTSPVDERDELTATALAHERIVFGLRMLEGIRTDHFESLVGHNVEEFVGEPLQWLLGEGLLQQTADTLRLTRKGLLVSDSIWPHLL